MKTIKDLLERKRVGVLPQSVAAIDKHEADAAADPQLAANNDDYTVDTKVTQEPGVEDIDTALEKVRAYVGHDADGEKKQPKQGNSPDTNAVNKKTYSAFTTSLSKAPGRKADNAGGESKTPNKVRTEEMDMSHKEKWHLTKMHNLCLNAAKKANRMGDTTMAKQHMKLATMYKEKRMGLK